MVGRLQILRITVIISTAITQYLCKSHFVCTMFFHVCNKSWKVLKFLHGRTEHHNLRFSVHSVINLNIHYIIKHCKAICHHTLDNCGNCSLDKDKLI